MSAISTLSKATDAFSTLQQTMPANDAMVKVAMDQNLSPEMIRRVAQLTNRASLNFQRLHTDGLDQKLAEAPIVDPNKVIQRVFQMEESGDQSKTASAPQADSRSKLADQIARRTAARTAKASEQSKVAESPRAPELLSSGFGLFHGLGSLQVQQTREELIEGRKKAISDLRSADSEAHWRKEALKIRLQGLPSKEAAAIIDQSKYHFRERGDAHSLDLVMDVADSLPHEHQLKLALFEETPESWHESMHGADGFVTEVEGLRDALNGVDSVTKTVQSKIAMIDEMLLMLDEGFDGEKVVRTGISSSGSAKQVDLDYLSRKVAEAGAMGWAEFSNSRKAVEEKLGFFGGAAGSAATNLMMRTQKPKAKNEPSDAERFVIQLQNPQHEAALSSIRSRAALQELIATDPVISASKPAEVIRNYNELSQHAPRAVEHTAVLRAALRQMLSNNQSIFDLQQLRTAER